MVTNTDSDEVMSQREREEKIFTCSMMTSYSNAYLESLTDEKLLDIYDRVMNA